MPIPEFNEHGLLPPGIHDCTMQEAQQRFARFQRSDRRARLFVRFEDYMREVRMAGIANFVILDGSFVTADAEPNDIDLVLVLPKNHDFEAELSIVDYNIVNQRRVRREFGLDVVVVSEMCEDYDETTAFFARVRDYPLLTKGLLRIVL